MKRERRSAKDVITTYANELLGRTNDKGCIDKLLAIETIAFRMGWNDLYNRLRFKNSKRVFTEKNDEIKHPPKSWLESRNTYPIDESEDEKLDPWWKR